MFAPPDVLEPAVQPRRHRGMVKTPNAEPWLTQGAGTVWSSAHSPATYTAASTLVKE